MDKIFARTELLLGAKGMQRMAVSRVAVFGLGGVGSFVVEALARSGIGSLLLIDADVVEPSNINRQLPAMQSTVGKAKVAVAAEHIREINPQANIILRQEFYTPEKAESVFAQPLDYIVDAVDDVRAKIDLAVQAEQRGINIISCMGAGNKLDPTKFKVADVYETRICPLARIMRHELRQRRVKSLQVVFSEEKPHLSRTDTGCVPPTGSIAFVPSVAGLIMAGVVVRDLAGVSLTK